MKKIMSIMLLCISLFFEVRSSVHKRFENNRCSQASFQRASFLPTTQISIPNAQEIQSVEGIRCVDVVDTVMQSAARESSSEVWPDVMNEEHNKERGILLRGIAFGVSGVCCALLVSPMIKASVCGYEQS